MASKLDNVISLTKRRGFVYPCCEIYGGTRAAWDYGPYGVELLPDRGVGLSLQPAHHHRALSSRKRIQFLPQGGCRN